MVKFEKNSLKYLKGVKLTDQLDAALKIEKQIDQSYDSAVVEEAVSVCDFTIYQHKINMYTDSLLQDLAIAFASPMVLVGFNSVIFGYCVNQDFNMVQERLTPYVEELGNQIMKMQKIVEETLKGDTFWYDSFLNALARLVFYSLQRYLKLILKRKNGKAVEVMYVKMLAEIAEGVCPPEDLNELSLFEFETLEKQIAEAFLT